MIDLILSFFDLKKKKGNVVQGIISSKLDINQKRDLIETVKIAGANRTIQDIRNTIENKQRGGYLRFGDGDIMLMNGISEMMHDSNPKLTMEMKETFNLNEGVIHKSLAIHSKIFGFDEGMRKGMHLLGDQDAIIFLFSSYIHFVGSLIYSPVALHYLSVFNVNDCIDFLNFLKSKKPIFVGNKEIKELLIEKLFGSKFIKTPQRNSYSEIDKIESELCEALEKNKHEFKVVVVAMGCAGRILQKRILKKGYNVYLFDFGSLLDAFNGLETRTWIRMSGVKNLQKILDNV